MGHVTDHVTPLNTVQPLSALPPCTDLLHATGAIVFYVDLILGLRCERKEVKGHDVKLNH